MRSLINILKFDGFDSKHVVVERIMFHKHSTNFPSMRAKL